MDLIAESNRQYFLAWRLMAEAAPRGSVLQEDDFAIACAGVPIPLFNTAFVFGPVSLSRLESLIVRARDYLRDAGAPGCFVLPEPWEPRGAAELFASFGMKASLRTTGMRTMELAPARYPLKDRDLREIAGDEAAQALAIVNTEAYGMDPSAAGIMRLPSLWRPPVRSYAVYEEGVATAVGAAAMLEGVAYILWMATVPSSRGKGHAEAIIRRALLDTGRPLTVLHATAAGFPVYRRMGYEPVTDFPGYVFPA